MSEAILQTSVISAARGFGFLAYATYRSTRSEPGFPDVVLVHPEKHRVIFIEFKTEKGKLSKPKWNKAKTRLLPGQTTWAEAFAACPGVEYMLVRPSNVQLVYDSLAR